MFTRLHVYTHTYPPKISYMRLLDGLQPHFYLYIAMSFIGTVLAAILEALASPII